MRIVSLSSGSKGNACVVEHDGAAVLIDCGIGMRTLKRRLADVMENPPTSFEAVLLTHSHSDHVCGLQPFVARNPDVRVFANEMTAETVVHDCGTTIIIMLLTPTMPEISVPMPIIQMNMLMPLNSFCVS